MSTDAAAPTVTVEEILRALSSAALLPLLPEEQARLLITPVTRAVNDVPLSTEERKSAARLIQANRDVLAGPLAHKGLTIPPPPPPVEKTTSHSAHAGVTPQLRMLAGGYIGIYAPFSMKELIKTLPGAEWSTDSAGRGCWKVPATPASAQRTLDTLAPFGPKASPGVTEMALEMARTAAARVVLDEATAVPDDDGTAYVNMALWDHQRRFVEFGTQTKALLFAVKMGGGKTGATIALANKIKAGRVLIISPNRVRRVWLREVRERSSVAWHIVDGTRPKKIGKGRLDLSQPERVVEADHVLFDCDCGAPVHAFCLNYEALTEPCWQRWEPAAKLDVTIWDEIHRLKDYRKTIKRKPIAKLTVEQLRARKAKELPKYTGSWIAHQWRANTEMAIGLSGTPMPQHPWDAFGVYRALDPGIFGDTWTPFKNEYIEMDHSGTYPKRIKPEKLAEFAAKVASIMYRPSVDLKLPGYQDVLRTCELEPAARKTYDELDTELWTDLANMLARQRAERAGLTPELLDPDSTEDGEYDLEWFDGGEGAELNAANILARLLRLQQLTGGTLRTDPREGPDGRPIPGPAVRVSKVKATLLAEVLDEIGCVAATKDSEPDYRPEPAIVFCRFRSDLDAVEEVAHAAGLRYGEISGRRGDGLNDDARMAEDLDVVGVQIAAGGTGIDLTRSHYGIWYSLGYSVSDYDQARARQYRPGQRHPVTFIHLQVEDTQDEAVYEAIDERRAAVSEVLRAAGIAPEMVGVIQRDPGPDPLADVDIETEAQQVKLPWE